MVYEKISDTVRFMDNSDKLVFYLAKIGQNFQNTMEMVTQDNSSCEMEG